MRVSEMTVRGNPKLSKVTITTSGNKLSEVVGSMGPGAHKRAKGNGFRGNAGENVKRVSRNGIGEVRDDCNAVPTIRTLV
jgi:hypothetical protein